MSNILCWTSQVTMEPACRKDKPKLNSTPTRGDRAKQKSAQQELKQRQRAEVTNITIFKPGTHTVCKGLHSSSVPDVLMIDCVCFPLLHVQIYALNKVMTELEQQQFEAFCKQMQSQGEWWVLPILPSSLSGLIRTRTLQKHHVHTPLQTHNHTLTLMFNKTIFALDVYWLCNLNMPESIVTISWPDCCIFPTDTSRYWHFLCLNIDLCYIYVNWACMLFFSALSKFKFTHWCFDADQVKHRLWAVY